LGELGEVVSEVVHCLGEIEGLDEVELAELDFDAEPPTVDGVRVAVPVLPRLADVCFAGRLELNRALVELRHAVSVEGALAVQEAVVRKLRRAIRAVFDVARESGIACGEGGEQLRQRGGVDLDTALAVRRLYADFRRALRPPLEETAEGVLTALRYAACALAVMTSSPVYAKARVTDRALLRRLHQRLVAWARAGKAMQEGLELLGDIRTSAELLRGINRRQELREHDHNLIRESSVVPSDVSAWFERLRALRGFDEQLDVLLEGFSQRRTAVLVDAILSRLLSLS
jgi:hypothetical protein